MKFVNQTDYPEIPYITRTKLEGEEYEKGKNTTIKTSGCGLCSAIMVLDRLVPNANFSLEDAIALTLIENYNTPVTHLKAVGGEEKVELLSL